MNTPKTILAKITAESIRENRWALRGHNITKTRLDEMDALITEHYNTIATMN